jgi:hypothetical protein
MILHGVNRQHVAGPAASPIPVLFDGTIPAIPCQLAEIDTTCDVDTGSTSVLVTRPFIESHQGVLPQRLGTAGIVGTGFGGLLKGRIGRLSSIRLGSNTLRDIDYTVFSSDRKGWAADPFSGAFVGNRLLLQFTMTLDYPDAALWLVPNRTADKRYKASR